MPPVVHYWLVPELLPGELVDGTPLPVPCCDLPDGEPVSGAVLPGERLGGLLVSEPLGVPVVPVPDDPLPARLVSVGTPGLEEPLVVGAIPPLEVPEPDEPEPACATRRQPPKDPSWRAAEPVVRASTGGAAGAVPWVAVVFGRINAISMPPDG